MEELARVYSKALFESARDADKVDIVYDQLGEFVDALEADRELSFFFFSPYFSSSEKKDGLDSAISGADQLLVNFFKVLLDRHRLPIIFRAREQYGKLLDEENQILNVEATSAVKLDQTTLDEIQSKVEDKTGRKVSLSERIDDDVVGGLVLRVGNFVFDASIRHQLERLRKQVAKAA